MKMTRIALTLVGACAIFLVTFTQPVVGQSEQQKDSSPAVPVATQWTLQALPIGQKATVKSVLLSTDSPF
jgi:hypothetical protein